MSVLPWGRVCLPFSAMSVCLLFAGCSSLTSTVSPIAGSPVGGASSAVKINGSALGGMQAISNASVTIYAMGNSGYGSAAVQLGPGTTTSSAGHFSFTKDVDGTDESSATAGHYACPAGYPTTNPQVYVVARGGDTTGGGGTTIDNEAATLVAAIGDCHSIGAGTQIKLNEVVTAATMIALQQFFNPNTESFGAPANIVAAGGLTNAVAVISTLVDISTGAANSSFVPASTVPGITMTAMPEYQKLNTIANILAACVNTTSASSSGCQTLFTNAVPPSSAAITSQPSLTYSAATDIMQAAYFMSINPTQSQDYVSPTGKLGSLFALPSAYVPFQPALTAQPMDWTMGVNYVPSGSCANLSSPVAPLSASGAYGLAIDRNGSPWVASWGADDVLVQFSATGGALRCISSGSSNNTAGRKVAIDSKGNIWWATNQGLIEYVTDTGNTKVGTILIHPQPSKVKASGIAADQNGNIYIAPDADSQTDGTSGYIYKYPNAANVTLAIPAGSIVQLGSVSMNGSAAPYRDVIITAAGNIFTPGTGSTSRYVYGYFNNDGTYTNKLLTGLTNGVGTPRGMALSGDGYIVGGNACCGKSGVEYKLNPTTGALVSNSPGLNAGGQGSVYSVAVDGANNIWTGGGNKTDLALTLYPIAETDSNFNSLSPQGDTLTYAANTVTWTQGLCGGSPSNCNPNGGFQKPWMNSAMGSIQIDSSGNVWATGSTSNAPAFFEIVGAAVPVVTPLVANLH